MSAARAKRTQALAARLRRNRLSESRDSLERALRMLERAEYGSTASDHDGTGPVSQSYAIGYAVSALNHALGKQG